MVQTSEQANRANTKMVMISSTARDLPEHRVEVLDACLRQGMFPVMMEHLPISDADAITESLRMVDQADLYLGIFAYRYGYIPKGYDISITEIEYRRAVERGIPRLIFLMHEDHPLKVADVERGEGATKLQSLRDKLVSERVVKTFKSPDELRAEVISSLSNYRQSNLTTSNLVNDIPVPPDPYIPIPPDPHFSPPYTLLQTRTLIGRQAELSQLTDWVTKRDAEIYNARIFSIVAIGGIGKSALSWQWFQEIAPKEMEPLAGRIWMSFYENGASFEDFVIRALAYVTQRAREYILKLPQSVREEQLLAVLNSKPHLVVLDGLERILLAYTRTDTTRLDDNELDQRTDNIIPGALGLSNNATQVLNSQHRLRKTADQRAGTFLQRLTSVQATRILINTRLYPSSLQTETGSERPGSKAIFLHGLSDDDAINLWRAFKVSGSRETLIPLFHSIDKHPLLIQVLAGEVANDRRARRDFDLWQQDHPDFNPFDLPLVQAKSHVLEYALRGLDEISRNVLHIVAAFRMHVAYDTLSDLLVGDGKLCSDENALKAVLAGLEDRGLLGWDLPTQEGIATSELLGDLDDGGELGWDWRANRYDMHPIVRGVTWSTLDSQNKQDIYKTLNTHFESLTGSWQEVTNLEDLMALIELYNTLIGLERYDAAAALFHDRLSHTIGFRLGDIRRSSDLLKMLFPDGLDHLPRLSSPIQQALVLSTFASNISDQPSRTAILLRRSITIAEKEGDQRNVCSSLIILSDDLRLSGALYESEAVALQALLLARRLRMQEEEIFSLYLLGATLALRGNYLDSEKAFQRSLSLAHQGTGHQAYDYQAMRALWLGDYADAQALANLAINFCQHVHFAQGMIRAVRLQGMAALGLRDLSKADECLHHALAHARITNCVEEELPALVELAELRRRQGNLKIARELLDEVWEPAEYGPFPLFHADACIVLAQIESDAGNSVAAVAAATIAYQLTWCNGPPFAYHWGLQKATAHLSALGVSEPSMPAFDASKYESMPNVTIEP